MNTLYSASGRAIAYIDDEMQHIYLYSGKPVAFMSDNSVYAFSGRYLGWLQNGWYYDRNGKPAFFTECSSGGPAKPAKAARPARGARGARPAKGARQAKPAQPTRSLSWSNLSDASYFDQ